MGTALAATAQRYIIRGLAADEMPLALDTWLRSLRVDARRRRSDAKLVRPQAYYAGERARAEALLGRYGALVATMPEVQDEVLGWICVGGGTLHYGYTKALYRGHGVCRELLCWSGLLPGAFEVSTMTDAVLRWIREGRPVAYNPYAANDNGR